MQAMANQLEAINNATNLEGKKEALLKHLDFLCETDQCKGILGQLINEVVEVRTNGNELIVFIPWEYTENDDEKQYARIVFGEPFTKTFHSGVPESFRHVFSRHNGVAYSFVFDWNEEVEYYTWRFFGVSEEGKIDSNGHWESEAIEEGGNEEVMEFLEERGKSAADVQCVGIFDESQNWYLLHPMKRNARGENAIVQFDHGDCDMESNAPFSNGLGGVVIRELAYWIRNINEG
ncbi:hypothetical protein WSM22_34680 [Cytophagales bacterium WSM2-2]|nr:hypothetical protein WSM22_34680 [Cytophagales bacterium WSM2-2]